METRRLLMAALLSMAVLMAWQALFPPAPPAEFDADGETLAETAGPVAPSSTASTEPSAPQTETVPPGVAQAQPAESQIEIEPIVGVAGRQVELETEAWRAVFDSSGARLVSLTLHDRQRSAGEPVELVRRRDEAQAHPFSLVDSAGQRLPLDAAPFAVAEQTADQVVFRYRGAEGDATKTFRVAEAGMLAYEVEVSRPGGWAMWLGPGVANPAWKELNDGFSKSARQASVMRGELQSLEAGKVDATTSLPGVGASWFSLEDKYFLVAVVPQQAPASIAVDPVRVLGSDEAGADGYVRVADDATAEGPEDVGLIIAAQGTVMSGTSFWGAKELTALQALPYDFEKTVRFGVFGVIAKPLLYGLRWINSNITQNWGWAIVLMTIAINLVLFPLRHKSYISMQKMQKLNPRMEAIRARFRPKLRDKQGKPNLEMQRKMNDEIQGLFKEEGVNPAMGCLPLLLQMPVFFAFYRLLSQAVELQGATWIPGWINDLSINDPFIALPLLMGATQFLQTKTMPAPTNPTQRILMNTMPVWFTLFAIFFSFPAGLVLYWLTNNVLTIIQQGGYNQLKKAGYLGGVDAPASSKPKLAGSTKEAKRAKSKKGASSAS